MTVQKKKNKKLMTLIKKHFREKRSVRNIRNDSTIFSGGFDLQLVINLPISNDGVVFYKRRLSMDKLTVYDPGSRYCFCYTLHEAERRHSASEIATAVFKTLKKYDEEKKI
ncbi:unnamed protein product [Psylliodes chrysocephalus]|uniref:Uncharacterized protein n=1 Tax=Psylliodes chrysocephalus TaxID=3402493 RepID=A0A9P0DF81_9CUCU|nr:unnamed protein product [Psylliodes chrysocephala]